MFRSLIVILGLVSMAPAFSAAPRTQLDTSHRVIISIRDQKLMLMENSGRAAIYPVSTSKYGVGVLPLHLHPRHAGRKEHRISGQLRLHQNEIEGCCCALRSGATWSTSANHSGRIAQR